MNSLSRREEDTLLKTTKAHALRECDVVVKGTPSCWKMQLWLSYPQEFAACASGRTISVAWACRAHLKRVQDCMVQL